MKHRARSSKIKYQHSMIKGLRRFLESIENWEEIKSILPGAIHRTKSVQEFNIRVQYLTRTGLKCLAFSGSAVQEVFIVTGKPDEVQKMLQASFKK